MNLASKKAMIPLSGKMAAIYYLKQNQIKGRDLGYAIWKQYTGIKDVY